MSDVFGLLGAEFDRLSAFRYSEADWQAIAVVVHNRFRCSADQIIVTFPEWGFGPVEVPLRLALEGAIGVFLVKREFTRKFPPLTARRVTTDLSRMRERFAEAAATLRGPVAYTYLERGVALAAEAELQRTLHAVDRHLRWLRGDHLNEPYPAPAAPKGIEPADGWQVQHQALSSDPDGWLACSIIDIGVRAFGRQHGATEDGPMSAFLRIAVAPVLRINPHRARYLLRKFRAGGVAKRL